MGPLRLRLAPLPQDVAGKAANSPPVSSLTAAARDTLGIVRPGRRNRACQPNKETSGGGQHRLAKQEVVVTTHDKQRGGNEVTVSFPDRWNPFLAADGPVGMWSTRLRCPHPHRFPAPGTLRGGSDNPV